MSAWPSIQAVDNKRTEKKQNRRRCWTCCDNRPLAQLLSGLETGHPVTVGQSVSHLHMISVFPTSRKFFFLRNVSFPAVLSAIHRVWIIQTQVGALLVWKSTWEKKEATVELHKSRVSWTVSVYRQIATSHTHCVYTSGVSPWLSKCDPSRLHLDSRNSSSSITRLKEYMRKGGVVFRQKSSTAEEKRKPKRTSFPGHNCANGTVVVQIHEKKCKTNGTADCEDTRPKEGLDGMSEKGSHLKTRLSPPPQVIMR